MYRQRLTEVTYYEAGGQIDKTVEYVYDTFDRRVSSKVTEYMSGVAQTPITETYVYDEGAKERGNILLDFVDSDGAGGNAPAISKRYLWNDAVDQIFAQEDVSNTLSANDRFEWLLQDKLNTVRTLLDRTGAVTANIDYSSFGEIKSVKDASGNATALTTRFTFTAQELDINTGDLWYSNGSGRGRPMRPSLGRFLQPDELGFAAGDMNLYRYVGNSPTNATDPSGQAEERMYGPNGGEIFRAPDVKSIEMSDGTTFDYVIRDGKYYTSNTWRDVTIERDEGFSIENPLTGASEPVISRRTIPGRNWDSDCLEELSPEQEWAIKGGGLKPPPAVQKALTALNGLSSFDMQGFREDLLKGKSVEEALAGRLTEALINEALNKVGGKLTKGALKSARGKLDEIVQGFGKIDDETRKRLQKGCDDAAKKLDDAAKKADAPENSLRPKPKTKLPDRVTKELPEGVGRSKQENDQARNFFERNREAARKWWSERNGGKEWPSDSTHDSHPRALKDGGDPMYVEPGYGGPNADHMIPRPEYDGMTDAERWGKMGGRPRKTP